MFNPNRIMKRVRLIVVCGLWLLGVSVGAQTERPWEGYLREVMTVEDVESAAWEETYELLCDLEQHPMNLNQVSREQLEQLPFLSAQQVEELMTYLYHYGPMKSAAELQMIRSLDYDTRRLLTYFIYIGDAASSRQRLRLKDVATYGRHELMATAKVPFYQRKGDEDGYQGYPYRHWLRYQLTYGDQLKAGIVGAQDAGEPFFSGQNRWGYDYYAIWLQLKKLGRIESLVLGNYRVSTGMGLILNNSFSLGKLSMLQNLGRSANTLRAHASRSSADYLQGAAATVSISRSLSATAFVSYRSMDATLNTDGTAATILTTGYHRTETELAKKDNLKNTTFGAILTLQTKGFHAGLNLVGTHLNRELRPNTKALYRQHYAQGNDFLNVSADYGYVHPRFAVNGETAMNKQGALATLNSLSLRLGSEWTMMALYRFYSYRYTALYAHSYSDGGKIQNESGLYLGATWQPSPRWKAVAYVDYAYFPWARYQVSQTSHAWDGLLQLSYSPARWTFNARYRLRLRQKDHQAEGASATSLLGQTEHRGRLVAEYAGTFTARTQLDFSLIAFDERERGLMLSETLGYTYRCLRLNGGFGYFNTDSYDSRVYLYEQGPLYAYSFAQFSGEGIRYWFMARANIGKRLMLTAKLGVTDYFDRTVIGSSYQQIKASSQTDLDLQVRWKF
jgi:hypothetical protein